SIISSSQQIAEVRSIVLKNTPWQTDQFKVFKVIVGSFVQVFHRQCSSNYDLDWEDYSVPGVMANQVVIVILETCRGGNINYIVHELEIYGNITTSKPNIIKSEGLIAT
ncbi:hypothetical protein LSH36_1540g00003, partial [Paralvinella palmiformis]